MRKILVLEHISIDGVIQAAGGPDEDPSGGFAYGGWSAPYADEELGMLIRQQMNRPFDLLLGRTTFEIWEAYWPKHADDWPAAMTATKFVASNIRSASNWQPSVFLDGDIAKKIGEIKQGEGPELHVWGSGDLIQTLSRNDLIDEYFLIIYPVTLGGGKKLFASGTIPAAFRVVESKVFPNGVIVVNYERAGSIQTGRY